MKYVSWIDDDFEKIIERIFKQFGRNPDMGRLNPRDHNIKSWYHGYTVTTGPDGKPVIREFGDEFPGQDAEHPLVMPWVKSPQENEPLTQVDVDEEQMKVRVLVEMPGVTKESINVKANEGNVKISSHSEIKDYDVDIALNVKVQPKSAIATYNNGILDLSFDLVESPEDRGVDVLVN